MNLKQIKEKKKNMNVKVGRKKCDWPGADIHPNNSSGVFTRMLLLGEL